MFLLSLLLFCALAQPSRSAYEKSQAANDASMLWGPYRPNLYLGLRPRLPNSLLLGLMWFNTDNIQEIQKSLRHTCEQDDGMAGYGWTNYDVREGGRQIINDSRNRVDMITDFVKVSKDGHHGGWGARITGVPRAHRPQTEQISVIIYLGSQDPASKTECMRGSADESSSEGILCTGTTLGFDNYKLRIPYQPFDNSTYQRQSLKSSSVPANSIWNAKTIFIENLQESDSGNKFITNAPGEGNLHFLQQNFEGEFEFDVLFSTNAEVSPMTSSSFTKGVQGLLSRFEKRFRSVYEPRAPFENEQHVKFSQSLLSNLMGGTGYFDGTSKVAASSALEDAEIGEDSWKKASSNQSSGAVQERGPFKLMSTVPSRPFFPRGFLWDEGFHLQVILDWDMDFALDIFSSWLDLMDEEGWIAREQILGPEVRSKVPQEFQIQYQHYANPPTLFFVIREFVARLRGTISYSGAPSRYLGDPEAGKTLLTAIFEKSLRHYRWFRRTQVGNTSRYDVPGSESAEGYRWRGWTAQHILTSGLDDYPRVQPPHPEGLHLDALCWTGLMAIVLKDTAAFLGKNKIQSDLSSEEAAIIYSIETLHWSELDRAYCDTTISEDQQVKRVCHKGYISLYPFFLGLVRNDTHLEDVMDLIQDSGELWSPYGLRSLGLQDQYYGTGENYWKGPIWINVNYMVLQSLLERSQKADSHQTRARKIYTQLRSNLVRTVYRSWVDTGFAWEQYNPDTGKGQRTQQFTGWTALIVKILAMPDLSLEDDPASDSRKYTLLRVPYGIFDPKITLFAVVIMLLLTSLVCRKRHTRTLRHLMRL